MTNRIHLSPPHMSGEELRFVHEAFETNWLSTVGPNLTEFEHEVGSFLLDRHCVALSSGTAAIHLAMKLLGVGPGDDVFCPSLTFAATINPAVYEGATPVFVDVEPKSWNLDPDLLAEAIEHRRSLRHRPKAVVAVHLFGQTADMARLANLCDRTGLSLVEDAAEALGATHHGRPAGTLAPLAVLSFNGNKIITTSGGGMLICEDPRHADKARYWATQARDPGVEYSHSELGYNYRLSNVLAGIGRGQLRVLHERVAARRRIAFRYASCFTEMGLHGLNLMPQADWGTHTNWLSVFTVDESLLGVSRDGLLSALAAADIEARPVWKPMHLQALYADSPVYGGRVSERLFRTGICLPSGSALTTAQQDRVIDTIASSAGIRR